MAPPYIKNETTDLELETPDHLDSLVVVEAPAACGPLGFKPLPTQTADLAVGNLVADLTDEWRHGVGTGMVGPVSAVERKRKGRVYSELRGVPERHHDLSL